MSLSTDLLLVIILGAMTAAGLVLLVDALIPQEPDRVASSTTLAGRLAGGGRQIIYAVGVGLLVLLLTRWLVAAIAAVCLVLFWKRLFGGAKAESAGITKIEALAAWTESLRDTVAGAVGLEQAIPAGAHAAAPAIQEELFTLSDRLRVRMPLPEALQRFAEDLDDASADLIIAALILNSRLRGPGLRDVLTSLAESARAELEMRQRVNAGRRGTRRSVQIVVGVTVLFVVGLAVFNRPYVEPYSSPVGQLMLIVIMAVFAAGVMWLRALSRFEMPERFLHFHAAGRR